MSDMDDVRDSLLKNEVVPNHAPVVNISTTAEGISEIHASEHEGTIQIVETSNTSEESAQRSPYTGSYAIFCDPQSSFHKGIALVLMCSMGFGSYFCYDNPGALQVGHDVCYDPIYWRSTPARVYMH